MKLLFLLALVFTAAVCRGTDEDDECEANRSYMPLCASDGVTYGNSDLLKCENEKRVKQGQPELTFTDGPCPA